MARSIETLTDDNDHSEAEIFYPDPVENLTIFTHLTRGPGHKKLAEAIAVQMGYSDQIGPIDAIFKTEEARKGLRRVMVDEEWNGFSVYRIKTPHAEEVEIIAQALRFNPRGKIIAKAQVILRAEGSQIVPVVEPDQLLLPEKKRFLTDVSSKLARPLGNEAKLRGMEEFAVVS